QARWRGGGGGGGFRAVLESIGGPGGGPVVLLRNGRHPASTEASMSRVACVRIRGDTASGLPPRARWCHTACVGGAVRVPGLGGFRRSPEGIPRLCVGGPPSGAHGECALGRPRRDARRPTLHAVSFPWRGHRRYRPGAGRGVRCHALPVLCLRESCRFTVLRPVRCAARPRSGACAGPARVHPAPSGREDPLPPQRTPWRAEAGDG